MTNYVVVAPLVGVNGADGKLKYLFAGTPVPVDVSEADVARLAAGGLIEKIETETVEPEEVETEKVETVVKATPAKAAPKKPAGASSDSTA
ncbi:hypothetical protein QM716_10340 [Rhodococcus sp. IEGM 1409]|uniref:hypothetical protein n=1 Tax=Rhodococcus sp. IEGM 1409 TaxID=3047082 RepID=UPI0024B7592A|nr:hypothetical protein [Rhodococcus sp. IEGM 1409]MDI9900253.1 hypothetical protein [Rhodococcus sp. IEGM 1409]